MQEVQNTIQAQGGGYAPPPGGGGFGQPPGAPGGYAPPGAPGAPMGGPPGGAPMAPPGGAPPPMGGMPGGGGADPALEKTLNTWFYLSILSIICGCCLLGGIPIYLTHTAKGALAQGDVEKAKKNLGYAKICVIIGWVLAAISIVLNVLQFALAAASS